MGTFSGWLDGLADRQFGKDASGRVAFFPQGWRRPGYYVEASDENKIKGLVTIYMVAAALVSMVGSMASLAFTDALVFGEKCESLREKLEFGLIVYAISAAFLYISPALLLWKIYKSLLTHLCASLATVGPESVQQMQSPPSKQRIAMVLVSLTGALLILLGVVVAVSSRHWREQ